MPRLRPADVERGEDPRIFEPQGPAFLALSLSLSLRFFDYSSVSFFLFVFFLFASCLLPTVFPLSLFLYIHPWLEGEQALGGVGPTPPLY